MTQGIDYDERIPNNVDLHGDRRLQRALESWQPKFLNWWAEMGPTLPTQDVYLRTAVNVGREGWAQFGHVAVCGVPLGYLPRRARPRPQHRLRRPQGRAGVAAGARASTAPTCSG